jgi:ankyrin repeat protein
MEGKEAVVTLLVQSGRVDPKIKDGNSQTALSVAAENGQDAVVKLLTPYM